MRTFSFQVIDSNIDAAKSFNMPVQVTRSIKEANSIGVNTATMYHSAQKPSADDLYKLEEFEKTQLDEVLDMCADYERQIEEEQKQKPFRVYHGVTQISRSVTYSFRLHTLLKNCARRNDARNDDMCAKGI